MGLQYLTGEGPEEPVAAKPKRNVGQSILRGFSCRCPACGEGKIFTGYLTVNPACAVCGEELHHQRADDAPPYFTITIVGHIIVPAMMAVEFAWRPAVWIHMTLWLPLTLILSLGFLRPVKGALIGLQWALYMHGFDPESIEDLPEPDPAASHRSP
ncbi:Protein of uncharacterised function (DUF983) [Pannonibacter phragmitetus]|uniref:Protein of uncharacterized function (DUF983) n=1 Tax=Pannonibacter phragmitetus TaxID=121719 RepID=A0A378ZUU4_9HYPH|nr:DUF983 domain-containing protein [Pannonibacter phragmitetus]SUB00858.1 Protein of uncharacterised function (DUF983) [Pannonibacter phragmitetus]